MNTVSSKCPANDSKQDIFPQTFFYNTTMVQDLTTIFRLTTNVESFLLNQVSLTIFSTQFRDRL